MDDEDYVRQELTVRGLPYKSCGLNADWCVSAWHLSEGEPNKTSGGIIAVCNCGRHVPAGRLHQHKCKAGTNEE